MERFADRLHHYIQELAKHRWDEPWGEPYNLTGFDDLPDERDTLRTAIAVLKSTDVLVAKSPAVRAAERVLRVAFRGDLYLEILNIHGRYQISTFEQEQHAVEKFLDDVDGVVPWFNARILTLQDQLTDSQISSERMLGVSDASISENDSAADELLAKSNAGKGQGVRGGEADEQPPEAEYTPATWEKAVAMSLAVFVVAFVVFLVIRNEPFADPNLVVVTRIVLSVAMGSFGATIPGFLHVKWSGTGLIVRAGGAMAPFLLTLIWSPAVAPQPKPDDRLLKSDSTSRVGPSPQPLDDTESKRVAPTEAQFSNQISSRHEKFLTDAPVAVTNAKALVDQARRSETADEACRGFQLALDQLPSDLRGRP